jgi:ribonucleotide reductase beta subunit family protein with ferritin-like domain
MNSDNTEPLLISDDKRFVMFPIQDEIVWNMYKKQIDCFWRSEEIDLTKDILHWESLNNDERYYISMILAFFAASDGIVLENLAVRFMNDVKIAEVRAFYGFQIAMENIHSETYSLLIETYIKDSKIKDSLFNAIENYPCIKKKAEWAQKWIHDENSNFATRLVAFACVEGIFFSGAFCSIFWLKNRSLMPGLSFSNQLISRDEALHTQFACLLYNNYIDNEEKLDKKIVYKMFEEAIDIEIEFIVESLPCKLIGMNSDLMTDYIKYVADYLLSQLNYEKLYNVKNPFSFMEMISMESKTNFFEHRVSEYSKTGVGKDIDEMVFDLNTYF